MIYVDEDELLLRWNTLTATFTPILIDFYHMQCNTGLILTVKLCILKCLLQGADCSYAYLW